MDYKEFLKEHSELFHKCLIASKSADEIHACIKSVDNGESHTDLSMTEAFEKIEFVIRKSNQLMHAYKAINFEDKKVMKFFEDIQEFEEDISLEEFKRKIKSSLYNVGIFSTQIWTSLLDFDPMILRKLHNSCYEEKE